MLKSLLPVAIVALMIGLAVGIIIFPRTSTVPTTGVTTETITQTQRTTQLATVTTTLVTAGHYATVTATQLNIEYYVGVETCTTVSGATTSYLYDEGVTTGASTIYPPFLPSEFVVTITTVDTAYFSTVSTATC